MLASSDSVMIVYSEDWEDCDIDCIGCVGDCVACIGCVACVAGLAFIGCARLLFIAAAAIEHSSVSCLCSWGSLSLLPNTHISCINCI